MKLQIKYTMGSLLITDRIGMKKNNVSTLLHMVLLSRRKKKKEKKWQLA